MAPPKKKKITKLLVKREAPTPFLVPFLFLAVLLLFSFTAIAFPGYRWLNPLPYDWNFQVSPVIPFWTLLVVLLLLALFLRRQPVSKEELPALWTRFGFLAIFGIGLFLCTYHFSAPQGNYWDDPAFVIGEVRMMKDLSCFQDTMNYHGEHPPIWPYTAYFLWCLLPKLSSLAIQRLTNVIFYLAAIVASYFVGKTLSGRRLGLYCAGLAVISKPLLYKVVSGYGYVMVSFFVCLIFWMTFRLLKEATPRNFVWWGLSLGLTAYSSYPLQPFMVMFILGTLLLLWWNNRAKMSIRSSGWFVWFSALSFAIYEIYCTGALPIDRWFWVGTNPYQPLFACFVLLVLIGLVVAFFIGKLKVNEKDIWAQWLFGSWLAILFSFPSLTYINYIQRIREHGLITGQSNYFTVDYLKASLDHIPETLGALFWYYVDRSDMSLMTDPFFSFSELILLALGLVFFLAKMDSKRAFILCAFLVGLVPNFYAASVHSGLLMGCLAPAWIMSAVGLEELTLIILKLNRSLWLRWGMAAVLSIFALWTVDKMFVRVYAQWAEPPEDAVVVMEHAFQDMDKGYDVYFSQCVFYRAAEILYEGHTYHFWNDQQNPIYLSPDEKPRDVVLYVVNLEGDKYKKQVLAVFPNVRFEALGTPQESNKVVKAYRCVITAADIQKRNNPLLSFKKAQGDLWERTAGEAKADLRFDGVVYQDKVPQIRMPFPGGSGLIDHSNMNLKLNTTIHLVSSGSYEFSCSTANRTIFRIDGKNVFDMTFFRIWDYVAPHRVEKHKINLEKGDHQVEILTYFQSEGLPDIRIKGPNSSEAKSLWDGFSF